MTDSVFTNKPETWPSFWADIINKVGFMGPLFFGLIVLIVICGNDIQKSELVDAVIWSHPNYWYSIVFWVVFAYIVIYYGIQRHKRKKSLQNIIEDQENMLRGKDRTIGALYAALSKADPEALELKQLELVIEQKTT